MVAKLDMSKAYDRMEWGFIESMLNAFGYSGSWTRLVMACISSVSYRVKMNGVVGQSIIPQRGLRQGDPMSPYLFIIAAEGLSVLLQKAIERKELTGFKITKNCPTLTHLFYADDAMIMSKADPAEAYTIQQIFNTYSMASGQCINVQKSGILFSKDVNDRHKLEISRILNMPICNSPGKYLGLPGEWQRSKTQSLCWIKDKVWQKLQSWKANLLTPAGKEVLIKAVVQAIPTYVMSVFILPKKFCDSIASMVTRFWWSQNNKERGIHWVSWRELKKCKKLGGLGFRDLQATNLALVAKQVWRIDKNPESLWVKVLKGKYFPKCSIWEAKKGRNPSWGWNSLFKGRNFLKNFVAWHIKDGKRVRMFGDKWLPGGERLWSRRLEDVEVRISDMMNANGNGWDVTKLRLVVPDETVRKILTIPVNQHLEKDEALWPYNQYGNYWVKTGYHLAVEYLGDGGNPSSSSPGDVSGIWNDVWSAKVAPKIKMFMWKCLSNALPTRVNLCKKKVGVSACCPVCGGQEETLIHLFTGCDWTKAVWFGSPLQWGQVPSPSLSFKDWFEQKMKCLKNLNDDPASIVALFYNILWAIWKARNEFIFESRSICPMYTIYTAVDSCDKFLAANSNADQTVPAGDSLNVEVQRWQPPSGDAVKVNIDAATNLDIQKGAIAVIVRDSGGNMLTGISKKIHCNCAIQAEAFALREAILLIEALGLHQVEIESDCKPIVDCFKSDNIPWQILSIVQDCKVRLASLPLVKIGWARRTANKVADTVAKLALTTFVPLTWSWSIPVKVKAALLEDKLVCPSSRLR